MCGNRIKFPQRKLHHFAFGGVLCGAPVARLRSFARLKSLSRGALRTLGSTNSRELVIGKFEIRRLGRELVEPSGIEPLTSCMPCRRSPS